MAPAGEMAQLVTMMSGQNSLCRDTQQDYTKEGENSSTILYLALLVFFSPIKKTRRKQTKESQTKNKEGN